MGGLPAIVTNGDAFRLQDLVNSDFKMSEADKDFSLSHEQLIKCTKILLYKLNLNLKKSAYEREELAHMIGERVDQIEAMTKNSLSEVNVFLHTIHTDFE